MLPIVIIKIMIINLYECVFLGFDDLSLSKMYIKQVIRHLYLNRECV